MGTVPDQIEWPPLGPEALVFRAYPFSDSFDRKSGKPKPKLFYRKDTEAGLSVGLTPRDTLIQFPGAAGMCQLVVSQICSNPTDPLEIVQDAVGHANIMGIPTRSEDAEKAIRIAKFLARIAQDVAIDERLRPGRSSASGGVSD